MNRTASCLVLLLLIASGIACGRAVQGMGGQAEVVRDSVGDRLDTYLQRMVPFGFSGAVLVARGSEIVLHKGYGWADPSRAIPVTTETVFDIGSLSKQFTATAILKLEVEGKLHTDDLIGQYLDGVPKEKASITIHHLLTHTSGLQREYGDDFEEMTPDGFVEGLLGAPLRFVPGEQFSYSNAGYALLAYIIERVSGYAFPRYMHEQLFEPADLKETGFVGEDQWNVGQVAQVVGGEVDGQSPLDWTLTPAMQGPGSVVTSVGDLYRWEQALRQQTILPSEALDKLFTPYAEGYAYGWGVRQTDHGTRIAHTGVWYAYSSVYRRYVEEGLTLIVLSNREMDWIKLANVAARGVEQLLFGDEVPMAPAVVSLEADVLASYAGTYRLSSGAVLTVQPEKGALRISADSEAGFKALFPVSDVDSVAVSRLDTYNQTVARILEETQAGRFDVLEDVVSQSWLDAYISLFQNYWQERRDSLGAFRSAQVLGTLPPYGHQAGEYWTYARLRFERGEETVYFWWWPDERVHGFVNENPVLPEMATRFLPRSSTAFVSYNLFSAARADIALQQGENGQPAILLGHGQEDYVVATRVTP